MNRILLNLLFFLLLAACNKKDAPCTNCNSGCSHSNGDLTGNWFLDMSGSFSLPGNPDPNWEISNPNNPVNISFKDDSVFSSNQNYFWKNQKYDRYKKIDSVNFLIYSSVPHFSNPVSGKILNSHEILLVYMGVDEGTEEKYSCY